MGTYTLWLPICEVELHNYNDRFTTNLFIIQVHIYAKHIDDIPCSGDKESYESETKSLQIKKEIFEQIAKSLCKIINKVSNCSIGNKLFLIKERFHL